MTEDEYRDACQEYTIIGGDLDGMVVPFYPGETNGRRIVFPKKNGDGSIRYRPVQNAEGLFLVEDKVPV